jgi:ElaB/YqjD/DUF883 family membrane-anchored ribosome-binding protein
MPSNNLPGDRSITDKAEDAGQRVTQATQDTRAALSDMARAAEAKVDTGRMAAADQLEGAAASVRGRADDLPGGERVQQFAHSAADRISDTADYLRTADTRRLKGDAETLVRENPGPVLLAAAVFGFLLGRALTRS